MRPLYTRTFALPLVMNRMQARKTQINLYEALATVLLLTTFATELRRQDVVIFVDNATAKGSLVRGFSASADIAAVAAVFWELVAQGSIRAPLAWVPSALNVADGPSRPSEPGAAEFLSSLGAVYKSPGLHMWDLVDVFLRRLGM